MKLSKKRCCQLFASVFLFFGLWDSPWDSLLHRVVLTFCLGLLSLLGVGLSWGSFFDLSLVCPLWPLMSPHLVFLSFVWVSVFALVSLLVFLWGSLRLSWALLVSFWGSLGLSWPLLVPLGPVLCLSWPLWSSLGPLSGSPGALLAPSWPPLCLSWPLLGGSWAALGLP